MNDRTMRTDSRGWNVSEIIDLPYGGETLRLRRDGTCRVVNASGEERAILRSRRDLSLLSAEDLATYNAWIADQARYAAP